MNDLFNKAPDSNYKNDKFRSPKNGQKQKQFLTRKVLVVFVRKPLYDRRH
jgi:hypothetical protein